MEHSETWFGGYTVETETDGIRVSVGIDIESVPLPAIKFRVESRRDRRVGVEVVHDVPTVPGVDAVGFHSSYGAENWTAHEDGYLTWAGVLDPGETRTTLYGVWLTAPREIFGFLEAPTVGRIEGVATGESFSPSSEGTVSERLIDDSLAETGPDTIEEMVDGVRELLSAGPDDGDDGRQSPAEDRSPEDPEPVEVPEISVEPSDRISQPGDGERLAGAVRAGEAGLSRPDAAEIAALDDGRTTIGKTLFVRALVTDRVASAPALLQELVTAMGVRGRRVVTREDGVRVDAVVDTDHDPRGLADALAARDSVVDVLVQPVDRTSDQSPPVETTEFDVLKRSVEAVAPGDIDAELGTGGGHGPGPSVDELVASPTDVADEGRSRSVFELPDSGRAESTFDPATGGGPAPPASEDTVRALVAELEALRDRVVELEGEVSELRVRNRRLEQLYEREKRRTEQRHG